MLAGGTDGGDESSIIENANLIVKSGIKAVVIIAGTLTQAKVADILHEGGAIRKNSNIMPTIHELRVREAREAIHRNSLGKLQGPEAWLL